MEDFVAMDSVIFYRPPTLVGGHHSKSIASQNGPASPPFCQSNSSHAVSRNLCSDDAGRLLPAAVAMPYSDDPRPVGLQPFTPATSRSPGHSRVARGGRRLTS